MPEPQHPFRFDSVLAAVAIGVLLVATGLTLRPFLPALLWGVVLAVTAAPLHAWIERLMPSWRRLAAFLTCVALIIILMVPILGMLRAAIDYAPTIQAWVDQASAVTSPDAPESIERLPLIGAFLARNWELVEQHSSAVIANFKDDIQGWLVWALQQVETVGLFVFEFGVAVVFAGVFLANQAWLSGFAHTFFERIGGTFGVQLLDRSVHTTRSTVRGVVGSAVAEAIVAGFGFWLAGVPAWLLLGGLTFFAALIQIGAPLVWIPVAIWLFAQDSPGWAIFIVAWGVIVVYGVENVSRPLLVSRSAHLPGLLIFVGVLGGLVAWGLIGVFLGPVILAVAYEVVLLWFRSGEPATGTAGPGGHQAAPAAPKRRGGTSRRRDPSAS